MPASGMTLHTKDTLKLLSFLCPAAWNLAVMPAPWQLFWAMSQGPILRNEEKWLGAIRVPEDFLAPDEFLGKRN